MTSGFFIKLETDDGADIEAVPHFWFSEGKCRIPVTELERKAVNNEMFVNWPIYEATILLQHSKLYCPFVCCIVCVPALQLLIIFQAATFPRQDAALFKKVYRYCRKVTFS